MANGENHHAFAVLAVQGNISVATEVYGPFAELMRKAFNWAPGFGMSFE